MRHALLQNAFGAVIFAVSLGLASADDLADKIKATYLTKFAPFVEWPAAALPPSAPFIICTQGDDDVAQLVERAATGQTVLSRAVEVRALAVVQKTSACHIAYLAGSSQQSAGDAVAALRGVPVLTITDDKGEKGGMIDFAVENNRVRFDIDEQAAADSGLAISSKLLSLARAVKRRK